MSFTLTSLGLLLLTIAGPVFVAGRTTPPSVSLLPPGHIVFSPCDVIELNNVYDEKAVYKLTQLIGWNVDDYTGRERAEWWVWWQPGRMHIRRVGEVYRVDIRDGGKWYQVQAPAFRETWTQHDRELEDGREFDRNQRWGL